MDFCQSCILENRINTPEAYERLLDDAFNHDDGLFTPWPIVELSWHFGEAVTQKILKEKIALSMYPSHSQGPIEAECMLAEDGHYWLVEDEMSN